jgi:hypothetical protein
VGKDISNGTTHFIPQIYRFASFTLAHSKMASRVRYLFGLGGEPSGGCISGLELDLAGHGGHFSLLGHGLNCDNPQEQGSL